MLTATLQFFVYVQTVQKPCGRHSLLMHSRFLLFSYVYFNATYARLGLLQAGGTTGLFGSTAVVLRAGRDYEEGEEFLVSYGPKGAAGYLEENGWVLLLIGGVCCTDL